MLRDLFGFLAVEKRRILLQNEAAFVAADQSLKLRGGFVRLNGPLNGAGRVRLVRHPSVCHAAALYQSLQGLILEDVRVLAQGSEPAGLRAEARAQLPDSAFAPPPTADVRWTAGFSCGSERGCNRGGAAAGRRGDGDGGIRGGERGGDRFSQPPRPLSDPSGPPPGSTSQTSRHAGAIPTARPSPARAAALQQTQFSSGFRKN